MVRLLQRAVLPVVMLGLGIASLVWGTTRHTREIFEEQEIEISLAGPDMMMPDLPPEFGGGLPGMDPGMMGMDPGMPMEPGMPGSEDPSQFGMPPMGGFPDGMPMIVGPPPELQKVKQIVLVGNQEPESQLVFEITIGGLVLLDTGELKRTYSGAPPSLCPT